MGVGSGHKAKLQGMSTDERILRFLWEYKIKNNGNSPSYREIGAAVGIASMSVVYLHVQRLADRGKIYLIGEGRHRGIGLPGGEYVRSQA